MMFATSYVEEEQHFWYWATAAWMAYLYASKYVRICRSENYHLTIST
jgi:hypothetical protein